MPSRRARIRILVLLFVSGVSIASTCATLPPVTKDIKIHDNDRLSPGVRVSYEILPGNETRRRGSALDLLMDKAPIQGERQGERRSRRPRSP